MRGYSPSRLEFYKEGYNAGYGIDLGDSEYKDTVNNVRWTDALGWYYIGKFNVKPSREFYRYVMTFPL